MDAGHREFAVLGFVIQVGYSAIRDQTDALCFEPGLQGQHQRVILVVNGALDARQRFNAGKLEQETVQVTPEFHGAMPGLERKSRDPHEPEFRLEEPGRKPVGDAAGAQRLFVGLAEFQQFDPVSHREPHRSDGNFRPAAVHQSCHRIRLVSLVELPGFVEHRLACVAQRWNRFE